MSDNEIIKAFDILDKFEFLVVRGQAENYGLISPPIYKTKISVHF